ncbi:hypothetical protein KKB40_03245 [Patescibacteria group bacterium]|nr:hypothetical protein [Patescibacteria group bacterium]
MQYITATELRTKSKNIIETLLLGGSFNLIYKSQVVGEIKPKKKEEGKLFNAKRFLKNTKNLNLPILTDEEIEKRYRKYMTKRHG